MPAPSSHPVALVTGAARRIGAAIARGLHGAGYDVVLHHRRSHDDIQALAGELEKARPGSTLCLQADLAEFDRIPELIAHTVGRFGRLDALVNNASTFTTSPLGSTTPALWEEVFASNARAPFFLAQAAMPHLRASRGAIVNITDIYGERPLRQHAVYCMAKAALLMMTRSLALELGPEVRVNAGLARGDPVAAGQRRYGGAGSDAGANAAGPHRHTGGSGRSGALAAARCALQHRAGVASGWRAAAQRVMRRIHSPV
jgi:pteridine reductase